MIYDHAVERSDGPGNSKISRTQTCWARKDYTSELGSPVKKGEPILHAANGGNFMVVFSMDDLKMLLASKPTTYRGMSVGAVKGATRIRIRDALFIRPVESDDEIDNLINMRKILQP